MGAKLPRKPATFGIATGTMSMQDNTSNQPPEEDEEEDYMNMVIAEPTVPQKETSIQRRQRQKREAEIRGRVKSKAELAEEEKAARDAALSRSMLADTSSSKNKGLAMMAKMGFKPGAALGSKDNVDARIEPIGVSMKEDRGGIGLDTEKKRKFREEEKEEAEASTPEDPKKRTISTKPLKQINILWRGLVRRREEKERDRRMRYDLHQSLSRLPTYDDADEDKEDKRALGKDRIQHTLVEDLEEEDPDLDAFNELDPAERLHKLVLHLREEYNYCLWCKFTYPDKDMEGCPGLTEEDHD